MSTPKKSTTKQSSATVPPKKRWKGFFARLKPETFFLVVALCAGLLFIFLTPPFQVPDEQAHFARAYQISQGGLLAEHIPYGVGGYMPETIRTTADTLIGKLPGNYNLKVKPQFIMSHLSDELRPDKKGYVHFENTALYSPVVYAPAAAGMRLTSIFDNSPLVLFYAARLFTMLAWVGLAYAAIRLIPIAKWSFAVLALAPMAMYQGASISADAPTLGFCFVTVAWFVRLALQQAHITKKQWLATILLLLALGFVKQPYALLGLLFAVMPAARFASVRHRWRFVGSALAVLAVGMVGWYLLAKGLYAQSPFLIDRTILPNEQLTYVLQNPLHYIKASLVTHFTPLGDGTFQEFVGTFGWLDARLPLWAALGYLLCLLLSLSAGKDEKRLGRTQRWTGLAIVAAIVAGVDLLLYMYWNAVGAPTILGIQGRYYLMIMPLVLVLLWGSFEIKTRRLKPHIWACIGVIVLLIVSAITITDRFYS
jgi:uncharacterized membrane protein